MVSPGFTVSDVKKVWSKLSPTPKELFCLDFLLRKDEQKLYRQKLLIFSKTFLVFEFSGHSGRHVMFRCFFKPRVCRNDRKNRRRKIVLEKIIVFGGTVLF